MFSLVSSDSMQTKFPDMWSRFQGPLPFDSLVSASQCPMIHNEPGVRVLIEGALTKRYLVIVLSRAPQGGVD